MLLGTFCDGRFAKPCIKIMKCPITNHKLLKLLLRSPRPKVPTSIQICAQKLTPPVMHLKSVNIPEENRMQKNDQDF